MAAKRSGVNASRLASRIDDCLVPTATFGGALLPAISVRGTFETCRARLMMSVIWASAVTYFEINSG